MIDPTALPLVLRVLTGWLNGREREKVAYMIEENRLLRRQLGKCRLRLTDDDRCARGDVLEDHASIQPLEISSGVWRPRIVSGERRGSTANC